MILLSFTSVGVGQTQGDILITEYMADPTDVTDSNGEYFELYNTTGSNIDIDGWIIKDDGSDSFDISGTLVIPAYDFIVIGKGDGTYNGRDYEITDSDMYLTNGGDEIVLKEPGGTEICRINYTDGDQFEPASCELNDISNHTDGVTSESDYVAATYALSENDKGSPGSAGNTNGTGGGSDPEPSNHVNNFTASANGSTQIDLSWNDNDGAQPADGFLIKANTTESFSAPSDGTDPNEDFDLSDGSALVKVNHGIESHSFTGLSASTQYYFKIWPYTNSGSSIDFKIDGTVPTDNATTSVAAAIVINEILADPDATNGDANGDGTVDTGDDEFVELYNNSSDGINISGYTIHDGGGERHVFPNGTYIQPHDVIVVFAGGTPTGFDNLDVQTSSSGQLSLNNSGDDVILKDASNAEVTSVTYGSEGGDDQSLVRDPIATGSFVKHTNATGASGAIFSPAKNIDGSYVKTPTVWEGTARSNSWTTSGNWSNGIPDENYRVVIPSSLSTYPTISAAATVNSIVIENGGSLVGQEYLTVNGIATFQREIEGYSVSTSDGWHLLSSPVNNMTIAGSDFEPDAGAGNDDFYAWEESSYTWLNYEVGSNNIDNFENGTGYLVAYENTATREFTGDLNTSDVTVSGLTDQNPSNDSDYGWNLVGNPFSSAIQWDDGNWDLTDFQATAKIRDESGGNYIDITSGGTNIIPVNQGFFVQAINDGVNLTIPSGAQIHDGQGFYKNDKESEGFLKLKVSADANSFYDIQTIRLHEASDESYDRYDSEKFAGNENAPQIYSIDEDLGNLSTHSVHPSSIDDSRIFPLGFEAVDGEYTASMNVNTLGEEYSAVLEDTKADKMIDFSEQETYTFSALEGDDVERFRLHLEKSAIGIPADSELQDTHIYANDHKIYIQTSETLTNGMVSVFNTLGQLIVQDDLNAGYRVIGMESKGAYIVKVRAEEGFSSEKVIIK
ncbi:MAG: lamin tail domain-containing protein [Bacteroidales bacterium]|nr:lamin tail domain-containing protein [Bacteroidales bacterium]